MGLINVKWQGSSLKQDASNRLVTDSEKTTWNNKANSSHTHTKSEVGLGNVDNTADSTKSVKYATSAGSTSNVIDVGAGSDNKSRHVWFSNTSPETSRVYSDKFQYNPATDVLTVGSITGSASSAASVPWSGVTGKPSTFTPSAHTHTKSQVGLGNVDNTADSVKSVKYATSAGSATKATQDSDSQQITTTYIKGLSVSGRTITYTKGDNTTGTITTQDTNTDTKVTQSAIKSSDYTNWRPIIWGSSNSANEGFTPTTVTDSVFSDPNLTYQPSSGTLRATVFKGKLSGTADAANSVAWGNVSGRPSSLPASDVYAWAKASTKPSYSWNEIASKPSTFTPSSHTHNYAGSNSAGGAANYVAAGPASVTSEVYRHVWFSDAGTETARCYNDSFKYDPKSNKLTVNISGSANSVPWSGVTGKPSVPESGDFSAGTLEDLLKNVQGKSPRMGSTNITKDTRVTNSWYNFIYIPHRDGIGGDNMDYGTLLLFPMTFNGESAIIRAGKNGSVQSIYTIYSSRNIGEASVNYATSAGTANAVAWSNVSGKPSTFPPSSHTHSYIPLSGGTITGNILPSKNNSYYLGKENSAFYQITGQNIYAQYLKPINNTSTIGVYTDPWNAGHFESLRSGTISCSKVSFFPSGQNKTLFPDTYLSMNCLTNSSDSKSYGIINFYYDKNIVSLQPTIGSNARSIFLPNASGTLQISSSDIRLKDNVKDSNINALEFINKIKIRQFDWKESGKGHQDIGFIADELEELDSNLSVGGGTDISEYKNENGKCIKKEIMNVKCVNTFYLQGYEVKAIQELSSKVDALEKENNNLKDIINQLLERVTTLENK